MEPNKKAGRYGRIYKQLEALMSTAAYPLSRMATTTAVLHHKMPQFFWTGFYLLVDDALLVHAYQGPVACMQLEKDTGVCWAGINRKETVVVPNVHQFPGHIACDARSQSEIVIPVIHPNGQVVGVLDVDSDKINTFDAVDTEWLEKIVKLIHYPI